MNSLDSPPTSVKIRTEGLTVHYGSIQALRDVNTEIPAGLVTAIIGPSGCGKSTYLRTLNRMNDIIGGARTRGRVTIDGVDIYGRETDVVTLRRNVGMVFQRSTPFPKSVFDNVAYGPRIHGTRTRESLAEVVQRSLAKAGLWDEVKDRLYDSALSLSGGQQQRLCIARALAVDPAILLMDEPASALDPKATSRIEDLIGELRGAYTIVIVTHNMQQASRVSDFTAFLFEGRLIEFGSTEQIFTQPHERQTEDYVTGRFG